MVFMPSQQIYVLRVDGEWFVYRTGTFSLFCRGGIPPLKEGCFGQVLRGSFHCRSLAARPLVSPSKGLRVPEKVWIHDAPELVEKIFKIELNTAKGGLLTLPSDE